MSNIPASEMEQSIGIVNESLAKNLGSDYKTERVSQLQETVTKCLTGDELVNYSVLEAIQQNIEESLRRRQKGGNKEPLSEQEIYGITKGFVFENIAIRQLRSKNEVAREMAPFEEFLLHTLKNPDTLNLRKYDWSKLTPDEKDKAEFFMEIHGSLTKSASFRNNDALTIDVQERVVDGKTEHIAQIRGVVEAKTYQLGSESRGESREANQVTDAPTALRNVVASIKEVYPVLMKLMEIDDIMPDGVEMVPTSEFKYTIVQPSDLAMANRMDKPRGAFSRAEFKYISVTRNELDAIAKSIVPFVHQ